MKVITVFGAYGLVGVNIIDSLSKFITEPYKLIKVKCDDFSKVEMSDYIIFAAGYGQPLKFTEDCFRTIEINTTSLMKAFSYLKMGGTLLYISSSEVYSGAPSPYTEESIGTTTPSHPRSCYIEAKRCGEAICHAYAHDSYAPSGVQVKIARLALAYGPGTKVHDTRVLNQFIEQGLQGSITLKDGGSAERTYIYIQDAVELMIKIMLYGKDMVYNIGGFSHVTILELAEEIGKLLDVPVVLPDIEQSLSGAPQRVELDMSHTLKEFDRGFTNLSQGLRKTIDYQKELYGKN